MKKVIGLIFIVALTLTLNSCGKKYYYWQAHCDTGHAHWDGYKYEYPKGEDSDDTMRQMAHTDGGDHDVKVHGGVRTAQIQSGSYRKKVL